MSSKIFISHATEDDDFVKDLRQQLESRPLIYAHEFSWDKDHDPVWKRLQKVFAFYDAAENLAFTHGAGLLSGRPPQSTHCNNVGEVHRVNIHKALQRGFARGSSSHPKGDIPIPGEYQNRLPDAELMSMPKAAKLSPLHERFAEIGVVHRVVGQSSKINGKRRDHHLKRSPTKSTLMRS